MAGAAAHGQLTLFSPVGGPTLPFPVMTVHFPPMESAVPFRAQSVTVSWKPSDSGNTRNVSYSNSMEAGRSAKDTRSGLSRIGPCGSPLEVRFAQLPHSNAQMADRYF
jgi:hypothetical protein